MIITPLFQGMALGASIIIPIGAQNSLILKQGIKRNYHLLAATICMICDVILIGLGIFGGGQLIASSDTVLLLVTWSGIIFLLGYGSLSFKTAWQNRYPLTSHDQASQTKKSVVTTTLAATLLNPHVYLDTVMILGSVGGQFSGNEKLAFAIGTMLACALWFYSLAAGAAKMSVWLARPKVLRFIDLSVGCIMWLIAYSLFSHNG